MSTCPHCGSLNNNYRYCRGCGRKLVAENKPRTVQNNSQAPQFIEEVINIIEENFYDPEQLVTSGKITLNLAEISREEGIFIIDGEQWKKTSQKQQTACFLSETTFVYLFSALITMAGYIAGANDFETIFQLYAAVFLTLSCVIWFLIPCFSGFSVISPLLYRCSMFSAENKSVKGCFKSLFTMFLFSSVPYLFVFPFFFALIKSKLDPNYRPLPFLVSEINYLEKIEEQKSL